MESIILESFFAQGSNSSLDIFIDSPNGAAHVVFGLNLKTSAGTKTYMNVNLRIEQLIPIFKIDPPKVRIRVARGKSKLAGLTIQNVGGVEAKNVIAQLPQTDILSISSFSKDVRNRSGREIDLKTG